MRADNLILMLESVIGEIPRSFRLVFDLHEQSDTVPQLLKGELKGVTGISAKKEILIDFFGVARDAMLVMNSEKLLKVNKNVITAINYDDPEKLTANNMALLHRIFGNKPNRNSNQVILNIFQHTLRSVPKGNWKWDFEYVGAGSTLGFAYEKENAKVNSVKELAHWAKKRSEVQIKKEKESKWGNPSRWETIAGLSERQWAENINKGIIDIGKLYSTEGEWIVNSSVLKIPRGSRLFVMIEKPTQNMLDMWNDPERRGIMEFMGQDETIKNYEDKLKTIEDLRKMYDVIVVNRKRYEQLRSRYWKAQEVKAKKVA